MTTNQPPGTRKKATKPPTQKKPARADRPDPWDRQPDETDPAWEAFRTYRDQGPNRSTAKTARALSKSKQLMDGWSSKHSWVVRAHAHDSNIDREWLLDQREMRRKAARRNATAAGLAMQKFGEFVLQLDPSRATAGDIAQIARVAAQIEKDALAVPQHIAVTLGGSSGAVDAATISGMTDEDRRARLQMLLREASSRLDETGEFDPDDEEAAS